MGPVSRGSWTDTDWPSTSATVCLNLASQQSSQSTIAIWTSPPLSLWRLSIQTTDSRFHVFNLDYEQIESLALHEIDIILQQSGKSLTDYHLPIPTIDFNSLSSVPRIIAEEKADNPRELLDLWTVGYRSANVEQKVIPIQFNLPLHLNAVDCSSSMDLMAPASREYLEHWDIPST